jgi:hypothetical protein
MKKTQDSTQVDATWSVNFVWITTLVSSDEKATRGGQKLMAYLNDHPEEGDFIHVVIWVLGPLDKYNDSPIEV